MQTPTMQSSPALRSLPHWQESDNESFDTDDSIDHPRQFGRMAAKCGRPSENAQRSASADPGGTQPTADARPPAQPRDAPLRHGVAWAATAGTPTKPLGLPLRLVARAEPTAGPPGHWSRQGAPAHAAGEPALGAPHSGRAARARQPASGGLAAAFTRERAAARALEKQRAQLLDQEQVLAELQQQAQETRQRIIEQEADLLELARQRRELMGTVAVPTEQAAPVPSGAPVITTLMISNIPMDVTQSDLLDLVDRTGFARRYDFAFMPTDFDAGTTKGYAIVNFVTSRDAREFSIKWQGSRLTGAGSIAPVLEVKASVRQGFEENAKKWKASRLHRLKNPELHPFIARRSIAS